MAHIDNIGETTKGKSKDIEKKDIKDPKFWTTLEQEKFNEVKNFRSTRIEKQWMINYLFYKGYQNMEWDKKWGRLSVNDDDPLHFNVNLIYSVVRAIRNVITRDNPTWDIDSLPYGTISPAEGLALGQYMGGLFEALGMKNKLKEVVMNGLLYGVGIFQYGYDDTEGVEGGEVWVESLDPFDTYIGGLAATGIDDAEYVIKVTKRSVEAVKNNPEYKNTEKLGADNKASESPWKELAQSRSQSGSGYNMSKEGGAGSGDGGTVLLHEMWIRVDGDIWVITTAPNSGTTAPLRVEKTEYKTLPFVLYHPDINPGEIYGEGWVKNLVPINRAINQLERQILKYNITFTNGKYIVRGGNRVPKIVSNENGQIIRVPQGTQFEQMDIKPLPSTPFNQITNLYKYLQDIGSAQDALMGRAPTGVTAGVAFETLVANNISNMADLIDNMTETLEELGEALIGLGYEYYSTTKTFKAKDNDGSEMVLKVVGKNSSGVEKGEGVIMLPENPAVKVTVVSGLAYTKGGKKDMLMSLRQQGDLDRKTLLDELGLDSDQIQMRMAVEQKGQPINDDTEEFMEGQLLEALRADEQGETPAEGEVPEEQLPEEGQAQAPATPEDLLEFARSQGVEVDPIILEDPELLQAVLDGIAPVAVQNGLLTIVQ